MGVRAVALAAAAALAAPAAAAADSTPVGPLPGGAVADVVAPRGTLVAIALPHDRRGVWRLARRVDSAILREAWEGDVGDSVVVVFRARRRGTARVVFALTRGDASPRAIRAITHVVRVR